MTQAQRLEFINSLTDKEAQVLLYDWSFWARPNQLPPDGDWFCWMLLSGRGFGKTRTGSEWILSRVRQGYRHIAIIGKTAEDVRNVMVEVGESSILKVCAPWEKPIYEPSKKRLTWKNGAVATFFSSEEPESLRGPQFDSIWVDELAKFDNPDLLWDLMEMGLRLGNKPQVVVTTTPKPLKLIKRLVKDPKTVVTKGSTFDNAQNLNAAFLERIEAKYKGTRLGKQELYAEMLEDVEGALWSYKTIENNRVSTLPQLKRIVISIDIAITSNKIKSDKTGITVCGLGIDGLGYLIADLTGIYTPDQWATKAIWAYDNWKADRIVAEANQGGDLIEHTLRTINKNISFKKVHASKGKVTRAEPIAALYEQNRIKHYGIFEELESQMTEWVPGDDSPDNMDSMVWAFTELMVTDGFNGAAQVAKRL